MVFGKTQALANAEAAYVAGTIFAGSSNIIELLNASDTVIATASDVTVSATNNILSFSSALGAAVTATDTVTGFQIRPNAGVAQYKFQNKTLVIAPASQDATNNIFTSAAHGMVNDQPILISGNIPTTNPVVSDGDTVYVTERATNTFKITRQSGGTALDITAVAGGNTNFNVMNAVGDENSNAIMKIINGVALTNGDTVSFTTFKIVKYTFSVKLTPP